uniref:Frizzled/Smoothened 7TM domain-containing protein n=1 Tax=Anopheles epiroticus TaxID=199890 RepID=A0A182P690_9DIPT
MGDPLPVHLGENFYVCFLDLGWAILCLRWSKSVRRLLGTDLTSPADLHAEKPNSSHDTLFQLAAWGIPAILTVIVLVARLVDADELFALSLIV